MSFVKAPFLCHLRDLLNISVHTSYGKKQSFHTTQQPNANKKASNVNLKSEVLRTFLASAYSKNSTGKLSGLVTLDFKQLNKKFKKKGNTFRLSAQTYVVGIYNSTSLFETPRKCWLYINRTAKSNVSQFEPYFKVDEVINFIRSKLKKIIIARDCRNIHYTININIYSYNVAGETWSYYIQLQPFRTKKIIGWTQGAISTIKTKVHSRSRIIVKKNGYSTTFG